MLQEFMEKVLAKLDKNEENFEKVFAKLNEHDEEFKKINAKLDEHDEEFKKINTKLDAHDKKFEEIDNEFKEIRQLIKDVDLKLDREMDDISLFFRDVGAKLSEHDKEFRKVNNTLLRLETETKREISILFDGYGLNREKSTDLETKQTVLEPKVELDSLRIPTLEDISKHHEKNIAKLLASNS